MHFKYGICICIVLFDGIDSLDTGMYPSVCIAVGGDPGMKNRYFKLDQHCLVAI